MTRSRDEILKVLEESIFLAAGSRRAEVEAKILSMEAEGYTRLEVLLIIAVESMEVKMSQPPAENQSKLKEAAEFYGAKWGVISTSPKNPFTH